MKLSCTLYLYGLVTVTNVHQWQLHYNMCV
nr:MAG TPA: hypothetical protein [Caudoviricetes sp.]